MKKHRSLKILFFECTAMLIITYGVYLFGIRPFRINNDQMFQYPLFYQEWIRLLKYFFSGKGLPMYSWYSFLGSDFYASMGYYVTGDIFLPLFFLFDIDTALIIETVLCIYISCFAMYGFLREAGIQQAQTKRFIALIYAFGGWATLFYGQYMFHRFYAFLPLLFFGIERYYKSNKAWIFTLLITILFFQNYYLMWPVSIFLFFYCLLRTKEKKRKLAKDIKRIGIAYFIGLLMACVILLPSALWVLSSPRVGSVNNTGIFWPLKVYLGIILSFITSSFPVYTDIPNLFQLDDNGYGYWYSLFITVIPLISSFSYIAYKKQRNWLILTAGLIVALCIKPLSSLMHGFSDPTFRWSIVIEFLLLYLSARSLDEKRDNGKEKRIGISILITSLLAMVLMLLQASLEDYSEHYLSIAGCLFFAIIIFIFYFKKSKIAYLISALEVACFGCLQMNTFYHDIVYDDYRLGGSNQLTYLQDTDEDLLYRYEIPIEDVVPSSLNYNISLKYHFLTAKTYNSLYSTTIDPFLRLQNITNHQIDITDYYALNSIGTKYWLVLDEDELPKEGDFTYITDLNSTLKVYLDNNYKGFGYTLSSLDYFTNITSTTDLYETLYVDDSEFDISSYQNGTATGFHIYAKGNNYLAGDITLDSANILYIAIPNDSGWRVTVDGNQTETISLNGGFMGIALSEGYHTIEMSYVTPGLKAGVLMSALGVLFFGIQIVMERKKNPMLK